jgi:Heavy metal binding domain
MHVNNSRNARAHIESVRDVERTMAQTITNTAIYSCPMHADVRHPNPGKCEKCGMDLILEGARFRLIRHMISNPLHLAVMVAAMLLLMVAFMMMMPKATGP